MTWLAPQDYNNLGPDAAKLMQTALAQNPDGIIAADWVPAAQDAAFVRSSPPGSRLSCTTPAALMRPSRWQQ